MKKIIINNILKGYNTFKEKIPPMQEKIEEFLGEPVFSNEKTLRIDRGEYSRQLRYHHKLFKKNGIPVIIIYVGETDYKWFSDIEIYIDDSNKMLEVENIVEKIREIMWEYPHLSDKRSETEWYVDYKSCPICGNTFDNTGISSNKYAEWDQYVCGNCGWDARKAKTIPNEQLKPKKEEIQHEKRKHRNNRIKKKTKK